MVLLLRAFGKKGDRTFGAPKNRSFQRNLRGPVPFFSERSNEAYAKEDRGHILNRRRCSLDSLSSQSQPNLSSSLPHFGQGVRNRASVTFAMWQMGQ